jgi:glycosyltransferase involved in cell wall biosynthesis
MRVLYIHQYFSTRAGATGTRSYEFARYLVTRHHKVTMLTSTAWLDVGRKRLVTRMSVDGIDVVAIGVGYSNHMSMLARLWSFASFMVMATFEALRAEADVVYASSTPLTVGVPGLLAARRRRVPFVFEVRDLWPEAPIELGVLKAPLLIWIARKLEEYLYARADHIVTLSEGMAEGVRAKGVPAERVTVITNAADTDLFAPGPKDAETVARYGLEDAFVVAYVGAMGPIHAIDQIVAAAQIVAKREEAEEREGGAREASPNTASHPSPPRTVFLLAGDGRTRAGLEARTRELGLDNVIWAGPVAKSAVPRLLATADVALVTVAPFPVLEKSSCNKAFDALAAGRPIVMNYGG